MHLHYPLGGSFTCATFHCIRAYNQPPLSPHRQHYCMLFDNVIPTYLLQMTMHNTRNTVHAIMAPQTERPTMRPISTLDGGGTAERVWRQRDWELVIASDLLSKLVHNICVCASAECALHVHTAHTYYPHSCTTHWCSQLHNQWIWTHHTVC